MRLQVGKNQLLLNALFLTFLIRLDLQILAVCLFFLAKDVLVLFDVFLELIVVIVIVGKNAQGCKKVLSRPVDVEIVPAINTCI